MLGRTWKPQLTVTGISGLPEAEKSGNVMAGQCTARVSLRIPPTFDPIHGEKELTEMLTHKPPYDAEVSFTNLTSGKGWNCPDYSDWLWKALNESSKEYFEKPLLSFGEGGSIPLMGLLNEMWPKAQFIISGVLGPFSNAHGPN